MDGKVATADERLADLAARQYGVTSTGQLREVGISENAIRGRVLAGRLHRIHRGVYAVGYVGSAPESRYLAAVLAVGAGPVPHEQSILGRWQATLSHRTAAVHWDLLPIRDGPVDVLAAGLAGRRRRPGIRVHRSRSLAPADVTLRRRIPVTTPERTISDLQEAAIAGRPGALGERELRRAIRQANVLGLPFGERNVDRTRSDLERDFLRVCRRHRLPPPEVNVRVGTLLVDFLWRDPRLIVETDGYRYHRGKLAFEDDRERDLELRRRGYEVLRLSERQVDEEPARMARTLAAVMRERLPSGPTA